MKKIINGKMYNTETAEKLTSWEHSYRSQVDWYEEMLYKKKTGEYFLYGNGNAGSKYARETSQNCYSPDETIIPITESTARRLVERNASVEEYIRIFGEPPFRCILSIRRRLPHGRLCVRDIWLSSSTLSPGHRFASFLLYIR